MAGLYNLNIFVLLASSSSVLIAPSVSHKLFLPCLDGNLHFGTLVVLTLISSCF